MNESILDVVHASAQELHAAGALDATTLGEFDDLCQPTNHSYTMQPHFYTNRDIGQQQVAACSVAA